MFDPATLEMIGKGFLESLYMTLVSSALAYLIGLPLGIVLVVTDKDGLKPAPGVNSVLGVIINLLRSMPFLILCITVIPLTRLITGTSLGPTATIVPLVIGAAPFIARMVESSLKEGIRVLLKPPSPWELPHLRSSGRYCFLKPVLHSSLGLPYPLPPSWAIQP